MYNSSKGGEIVKYNDDFKLDRDKPEDPYERGFADKLYGDDEPYPDYEAKSDFPMRPRPDISRRTPQQEYRPKKKKKHRILKVLLTVVLSLVLVLALLVVGLHFLAKQPEADNDRARKDGNCTILLAGTDESGDRTDTIMLLNLNREEGRMSLMSIPRDTKVNSTYTPHSINIAYGVNGKGEEGMDSLMDYVADCVGFRPDGYVLLELDVFIELVDLFGGVEFDVPMDMHFEDPSQDLYIDLSAGLQTLDGEQSMWLVRYRKGYADADIGRVSVQRDFLMAAMDQWASIKNAYKLPQAFSLLSDNAVTDLSARNMLWLAETALLCGTDDIFMTTVPFKISENHVIIDADEDYLDLLNEYFNPYERDISWEDLYIAN